MKFVLALLIPVFAVAQNVRVDEIKTEENTTIEIRKGEKSKTDRIFEITEGDNEIAGDPAALLKEARQNWKKACGEWKTELKDLNKENQVLVMNCGTMNCATAAMETSCKSQAKYKLKVQVK